MAENENEGRGQGEILEAKKTRLCVMTVNVCGPKGYGFEHRKEAAFETFKPSPKGAPDIVGFQELAPGNWEEVFCKARPDMKLVRGEQLGDFVEVNPIAYNPERVRLIDHGTIWLSPDRSKKKIVWDADQIERAMTWAVFEDIEAQQSFLVQNIHPDNKAQTARAESFKILLEEAQKRNMPTIVTADSNISVHSPRRDLWAGAKSKPYFDLLDAGFRDTWCEAHPGEVRPTTFHFFRGPRYNAIKHDGFGTADTDWILVRGPWGVEESWVVYDHYKGIYPSDHYAVQSLLEWR